MIWLVAQEEKSDNHIMHLFLSNVSTQHSKYQSFSLNYLKRNQIVLGLLDCSINFICQERLDRFYGLLFSYFCWSLTGWNDSIQRHATRYVRYEPSDMIMPEVVVGVVVGVCLTTVYNQGCDDDQASEPPPIRSLGRYS